MPTTWQAEPGLRHSLRVSIVTSYISGVSGRKLSHEAKHSPFRRLPSDRVLLNAHHKRLLANSSLAITCLTVFIHPNHTHCLRPMAPLLLYTGMSRVFALFGKEDALSSPSQ